MKELPFLSANLVFLYAGAGPAKESFFLLEETVICINLGDYQELYIWHRLYEAREGYNCTSKKYTKCINLSTEDFGAVKFSV